MEPKLKVLALSALVAAALGAPAAHLLARQAPAPAAPASPTFETMEHRIRVVHLAEVRNPNGLAFLPNGDLLVSQMNGDIRILRNGKLVPDPVGRVPGVHVVESGPIFTSSGLMEIALHPRFAQNRWVYYSYVKPALGGTMAVGRATFDGSQLRDYTELFAASATGPPGNTNCRLAFAPDGTLYVAVSHHNNDALSQDLNSHGGKVLRLRDDGTPMPGNPFIGQPDKRPEIFTYGHRGIHGLAVHPATGQLWIAEHGDELNIARAGGNYGWPFSGVMGQGGGTPTPPAPRGVEIIGPYISWNPAINLSGLMFYTGDRFPRWKGHIFLGGLREQLVHRLALPNDLTPDPDAPQHTQTRETLFTRIGGMVRNIRQGPDGLLYIATVADPLTAPGSIMRLEPAARSN
jgi:glucose/arabinose dehydrogenase